MENTTHSVKMTFNPTVSRILEVLDREFPEVGDNPAQYLTDLALATAAIGVGMGVEQHSLFSVLNSAIMFAGERI